MRCERGLSLDAKKSAAIVALLRSYVRKGIILDRR